VRAHMEQCQGYLQQLSGCLSELGLTQHQVRGRLHSTCPSAGWRLPWFP
jgi:hypothetical protein